MGCVAVKQTKRDAHAAAVEKYREASFGGRYGRENRKHARDELRGKDLACWCALDYPCHADVLLEIANA